MTQGTTDERLDRLEEKVEDGFGQVDLRLAKVDLRLEAIDERFELFDKRMDGIESSLERLADGQAFIQKVILGGCVSLLCAVVTALAALVTQI